MRNWNRQDNTKAYENKTRCEPTYEELKRYKKVKLEGFVKLVASLPMRNWNNSLFFLLKFDSSVASLPMRNWNSFFTGVCMVQVPALRAYLWGIETKILPVFLGFIHKLRAYLWGIETSSSRKRDMFLICCEPTYEELKLDMEPPPIDFILGCEPTYEELKLFLPIPKRQGKITLRAYLWGIETQILQAQKRPESPLRAYLWGIETPRFRVSHNQNNELRAYLWGIETVILHSIDLIIL